MNKLIPLLALALASCATTTDSIEPEVGSKCPANHRDRLAALSAEQDRKARTDVWSVALVGVPASAFTGDNEKEIAKLKGCEP